MKAPIEEPEWTDILGEMGAVWTEHEMHPDEVVQALCRGLFSVFSLVRSQGVPSETILEKLDHITLELVREVTRALKDMEDRDASTD